MRPKEKRLLHSKDRRTPTTCSKGTGEDRGEEIGVSPHT